MKTRFVLIMKNSLLIAGLAAAVAVNAFADTHYVSHSGSRTYPYTSWATAADNIQSAVYAATEGDTVMVAAGAYYPGERIMVTNEIAVRSDSGADVTSVDGGNAHGCFRLGTNSVVDGFTITNGNDDVFGAGGGVICWGGGTVENCTISGNSAGGSGGGVWIREGGTVRNCTISGNVCSNQGGGVECHMGGAIVTNCVISDNWAYYQGGGVECDGGSIVSDCRISRNYAINGGGVACRSGALIVNSTISSNSGGGVFCSSGGVVSNCTIIGNQGLNGAGMFCSYGGEAIHCKFTGNIAGNQGGGAYCSHGGTLNLCIFTQNLATNSGGGVLLRYSCTLNNSLIYDNRAVSYNGGGVDCDGNAEINNCTISSNTAGNVGGGFYCHSYVIGTNRNCVIYHNTALSGDGHNYYIKYGYPSTNYLFMSCCTTPTNNLPGGAGCIDSAPEFVDMYVGDFRLVSISPCIDAGNNAYSVGNYDLDGNVRISGGTIDMGAYEYITSPVGGPYRLFVQSENPSGISIAASPNDNSGLGGGTTTFIRTYNSGVEVGLDAPGSAGGNGFSYWLLDGANQGGSANLTCNMTMDRTAKAVYGGGGAPTGDVYYVSLSGAHTYPYTNWVTAANDIQSAVDAAAAETGAGAMVLVTNGTYFTSSRIVVTNSLNVRSVNGATVTHVNGNRADGCFLISGGTTLDGFTITNGHATGTGWEEEGGGVYCDGGIVQNCAICGNKAGDDGGGVFCNYSGTVVNCSILGNAAGDDGGGVACNYGGVVSNCMIMGNSATNMSAADGGGVECYYGGDVSLCTISGNSAYDDGGGIRCYNAGRVNLCTISGNSAGDDGGGIYNRDTTVNNCAMFGNSARDGGGGAIFNGGVMNNCTISGNQATDKGGGVYCDNGTVHNSIVYFNSSPDGPNYYNTGTGNEYGYCCLTPNPGGAGNITADPEFVDAGSANYRLGSSSPCINQGNNAYAVGNYDLDGGVRIVDGTVDMGAYEYGGLPDLMPAGFQVKAATATEGEPFWIDMVITNTGLGNAGSSHLRAFLTTDLAYTNICEIGEDPVAAIPGGGATSVHTDFTVPHLASGTYSVWLVTEVDCRNEVHESNESNSYTSTSIAFTISDRPGSEYVLTVQSRSPWNGVPVGISPQDKNGAGDGETTATRIYDSSASVALSAPGSADGNEFSYWTLDGVNAGAGTNLQVSMTADHSAIAVYTGAEPSSVPIPTNPTPTNSEVNVSVRTTLSWEITSNSVQMLGGEEHDAGDNVNGDPRVIERVLMQTGSNTPLFTTIDNQDNAGTGNPDYDMDVFVGAGDAIAPIEFDISYTNSVLPATVQLLVYAKDIDETDGEIDDVYFNGTKVGSLTGADGEWSTTVLDINPSLVVQGNNLVRIEVSVGGGGWVCRVDWGQLVINGEFGGAATIRYAEPDKPVYSAGETVTTTIEIDTTSTGQTVRVETNLLEPGGTNIAGTSRTYLTLDWDDDPFDESLGIPAGSPDGTYYVQMLVYDEESHLQDQRLVPFGVGNVDLLMYDVYFGMDTVPVSQVKTNLTYRGCWPGPMVVGTTYYWQVVAKNSGGQSLGPVWSFTTGTGAGPPSPPSSVTASDGTHTDRVIVSWDASGGATKYRVFRDGAQIAEVTDTSYEDTAVTLWQTYSYYVQAGNDAGWSAASATDTGYAGNLAPPTGVTASDGMFSDRVRITWDPSVGATKYQVYRDGRLIADVTDTTYDDTSVAQWQVYEYTVKAGNDYIWTPASSDSDTGYAGNLAPPTDVAASDGTYANRVRITWNPSVGATSYRLYRDGAQIAEIIGTSYDDMSVTLWQTYEYSVKAGNGAQWTPESDTDTGYAGDLAPPTGIAASDGAYTDRVRVTWNASAGATTYRVYRDTEQIAETSSPTYDDMSVVLWQLYDYRVSAGNASGWTPQSTNDTGYAGSLATPADVTASDGLFSDRVRVTWNTSAGATAYRVYRDGAQIAEISGTTYDDTSVTAWQTYDYAVKAGNASGWTPLSTPDTGYAGDLAPPTGVNASDGTYTDRVRITWNASSGATKYRVFRDGIYLVETTATTYEDTSVTPWQTYEYTVKAGNSSFWTPHSAPDTGYAGGLAPPTDVAASDGAFPDRVYITWAASSNATKYSIHRDGVYIAETTGTNHNDTTVTAWQTYEYCVKAGNASGWTPCSQADTGYAGSLAPPTGVAASDGLYTDRVRVTWNASPGATQYQVFRDNLYITDTTGTSYDDTSALAWQTYSYTIKAGNASFWTPHSAPDTGYAGDLAPPSGLAASDGLYTDRIRVTWNASTGATKYEVYRDSLYITETIGTSYNDMFITPAQMYSYSVRAGNASFWTPSSASDSGYAALAAPTGMDASDGTYSNMVRVTWNTVAGAISYKVYRATTDVSAAATMIGESASPYDDTSAEPAKVYYYWVKSSSAAGDSSFSAVDKGYAFKPVYPMVSIGKWKVKHGKTKGKVKGKEIEELSGYLSDGCRIGIRDKDTTNIVDGPRVLETKIKKKTGEVKFWYFKLKKNAVIKYKVKKSKLIYKVWQTLPANPIIFLVPADTAKNGAPKSPPDTGLEFHLEPAGPADDNGWRSMKSTVVEPEE